MENLKRGQDYIKEFLNNFPLNEKGNYKWDIISIGKNGEKIVFRGKNDDENIYVKQLLIKDIIENKNKSKIIYKEAYFNFALKNKTYFSKCHKIMLSVDEKYLFLAFKNNSIPLKDLIESKVFDYKSQQNLIKWIIYQITFGLYTLHSNNIIHHDIKPSNILIDEEGQILICDLGSSLFIGEDSYEYTLPYASPELLLENYKMNEKYDMWSLGVVILELYSKENNIFGEKDIKSPYKQLNYIFSKLGINYEDCSSPSEFFKKKLNKNENIIFNINQNILEQVEDNDAKDLIKKLLSLNPKYRPTAKEVLNSEYLKPFESLDSLDIESIEYPEDYEKLLKNSIDQKNYIEFLKKLLY